MSATNNWQRFEYKYIIPLPIVGALISDVLCFSKPDAYATSSGDYEVRSIYFDTHDLRLFDEKIAGVCNRKKYRVRSYEPFPKSTSKVYLEIKEKEKDVILKRRAILPLKEVEEVINGHSYKTEDPVVKEWRVKIPSVTHVDGSGRLQTIRREQNQLYYDLIKAFGKLSGIPILINTSFNILGEPIVCSPHDAYKCMMGTGIDYIVMGKFLIKRGDNL